MFNFFKKKDNKVNVTFEAIENDIPEYTPWKNNIKNSDTEFSNVVFLQLYTSPREKATSPDDYPRYVSYELGIYDPLKKFDDMLDAGMLEQAEPMAALAKSKVAELKEILQANNLPVNGKKADLIERIKSEVNIVSLELPTMYTVSEKGKEYFEQHEDLLKLHGNNYNISYEEYKSAKAVCPLGAKYDDVIWHILNDREMSIPLTNNGERRNNYLYKAKLLQSENRFVDALTMYAVVLYYDINIDLLSGINPKDFVIAPAIETNLIELKDHYIDKVVEHCFRCDVYPKKMIKPESFEKLLKDVFAEKFKLLTEYL